MNRKVIYPITLATSYFLLQCIHGQFSAYLGVPFLDTPIKTGPSGDSKAFSNSKEMKQQSQSQSQSDEDGAEGGTRDNPVLASVARASFLYANHIGLDIGAVDVLEAMPMWNDKNNPNDPNNPNNPNSPNNNPEEEEFLT